MSSFLNAVGILCWREWIRFFRSPGRIIGAIGAPLIFWGLLGSGLNRSFTGGQGYLEFFYPGMLALTVLFTAIFASISLIEDRREGFLQAVLVTRVPRSAMVLGKVLGTTVVATAQTALLLALAPLLGYSLDVGGFLSTLLVLFLMGFSLAGLGFLCAWKFNSVQSFHSVMNLLLFPMWLLSGALFPAEGATAWVRAVMLVNPLTYGVTALRGALMVSGSSAQTFSLSLALVALFAAGFLIASTWLVSRSRRLVAQ